MCCYIAVVGGARTPNLNQNVHAAGAKEAQQQYVELRDGAAYQLAGATAIQRESKPSCDGYFCAERSEAEWSSNWWRRMS